jgi:acetoin utilization deacetylase AcuC-like enzyme
MIIGVTGGRDYDNWDAVCEAMQEMRPTRLVVGDAAGADALVRDSFESAKLTTGEFNEP